MQDVPPAAAFEPDPDEPVRSGGWRRRLQITVTVIVVAALVVLAAVEGGGYIIRGVDEQAPPTVPPPRLVMVDGTGALSWMDRGGRARVAYSKPGTRFQFPAWSPDATRIAAIGASSAGTAIYVVTAGAPDDPPSEPVVAYESAREPPFYLYWTPDGRKVTFLTQEADGLALRVVPADGSAAATIVRTGSPMYWDFVEPTRLLVHSGSDGPEAFHGEVDLDGEPIQGSERATGPFRAPAVSPDRRYRAYLATDDDSVGEVVREARDGSGTTRIRVFGTAAMSFSPAGDELAFIAPDRPSTTTLPLPIGPLRVLGPAASEARTIHPGNVVAFFWSPTGKHIAVLLLQPSDDQVTEAVARPAGANRAATSGLVMGLAFVDVVGETVRSERAVRLSDLFVNQVLPFFDQYALSHRFWSPDGTAVVLPTVGDDDVTQVSVIPADGSAARILGTGEMGSWTR